MRPIRNTSARGPVNPETELYDVLHHFGGLMCVSNIRTLVSADISMLVTLTRLSIAEVTDPIHTGGYSSRGQTLEESKT